MPIAGLESLDGKLLDGLVFCRIAYDLFEAIQEEPTGLEEIRLLRSLRAKRMVEEVLPIAAFVQNRYGLGLRLRVRWRGGSQRYDARVLCNGRKADHFRIPAVQHLEITTAVHQDDYLVREHLHREGFAFSAHGIRRDPTTKRTVSEPYVRSGDEAQQELAAQISSCINSKASKPYPRNTTLVVRCVVHSPVLEDEWLLLLRILRRERCPKRFREVVIIEPVSGRVTSVFERQARQITQRVRRRKTRKGLPSAV